ncbi:hypothetical protein Zmor_022930 [Zophobas morio]|uniref:Uncharacterized protein n=1 Tax=Zophobas morio TaxID=2755281 RepID=A0AA38M6L9_9CUCU|nr:hypothetical protein Zmor_022930 [Zophobas morio]
MDWHSPENLKRCVYRALSPMILRLFTVIVFLPRAYYGMGLFLGQGFGKVFEFVLVISAVCDFSIKQVMACFGKSDEERTRVGNQHCSSWVITLRKGDFTDKN